MNGEDSIATRHIAATISSIMGFSFRKETPRLKNQHGIGKVRVFLGSHLSGCAGLRLCAEATLFLCSFVHYVNPRLKNHPMAGNVAAVWGSRRWSQPFGGSSLARRPLSRSYKYLSTVSLACSGFISQAWTSIARTCSGVYPVFSSFLMYDTISYRSSIWSRFVPLAKNRRKSSQRGIILETHAPGTPDRSCRRLTVTMNIPKSISKAANHTRKPSCGTTDWIGARTRSTTTNSPSRRERYFKYSKRVTRLWVPTKRSIRRCMRKPPHGQAATLPLTHPHRANRGRDVAPAAKRPRISRTPVLYVKTSTARAFYQCMASRARIWQ